MNVPTLTLRTDKFGRPIHPAWLIDATPGAVEAKAALDEIAATLPALQAAASKAARAAGPLGYWQPSVTAGQPIWTKKPEVATPDFDAAESARRAADRALAAAKQRERATWKKLDDLIWNSGPSASVRRSKSASFALERQNELTRLWAQFKEILQAREEALSAAKYPGRNWFQARGISSSNDLNEALKTLEIIVSTFDTQALRAVAEGDDIARAESTDSQHIRPVGRPRRNEGDPSIVEVR